MQIKTFKTKQSNGSLVPSLLAMKDNKLTYVEALTNEGKRHNIIQLHDCIPFYI